MQVGVIGLNHKLADVCLREQLASFAAKRLSPGNSLHPDHALILLSTCNRTEIYFSSPSLSETHSYLLQILLQGLDPLYEQKFYSFFRQDCFRHLLRVTSGLDSAILHETEIQGQVKKAYQEASFWQKLPFDLHYLFQKALKVGKEVRSTSGLPTTKLHIEHRIRTLLQEHFTKEQTPSILLVGASHMNRRVATFFLHNKVGTLTWTNRTDTKTQTLAKLYPINVLFWEELSSWPQFDVVIVATKSTKTLLQKSDVSFSKQRLLFDLSVPRNIDNELDQHQHCHLYNIDDLGRCVNTQQILEEDHLLSSEEVVIRSTQKYSSLYERKMRKRQTVFSTQVI